MYITTNIPRTANQAVDQIKCPIVCEQQLYAYVNLLGIIFGIFCLVLYFVKKRFFLNARSKKKKFFYKMLAVSSGIFLILFLLYFLKIEYKHISGECPIGGVLLSGSLFPDILHPLYGVH